VRLSVTLRLIRQPYRDDVISADEASAYVESLKRDLTLRMDGRNLDLKLTKNSAPARELSRSNSQRSSLRCCPALTGSRSKTGI